MSSSAPNGQRPRELDAWHMQRALSLAANGLGAVEPNPMVGCVIARGAEVIGEGWHERYGGPHAEVAALAVAGPRARGAVMYVTLEPCCHFGKTPPCTGAIIDAGIREVVIAEADPFPQVGGGGIAALRAAGITVDVGVLESAAHALNAPYHKLLATGRPWTVAKWAMTLDGHTATRTGASRWISNHESRRIAHRMRGRMDAIIVGRGTVVADDPLLTARPPGQRIATRIVVDTHAALDLGSQIVRTAAEGPVLVAVGREASADRIERLRAAGCEVFVCAGGTHNERLKSLLGELGRCRMTNVMVEGGSHLLGSFFDIHAIDEVHVFIAPKLFGGADAPPPIAGAGIAAVAASSRIDNPRVEVVAGDIYISGRVAHHHDEA